jgi:5-methyltetrahydrofolate--homocysteine methyltransferase
MTHFFQFRPYEWQRIEQAYNAWWAGELERPLLFIEAQAPEAEPEDWSNFITRYDPLTPIDQILDEHQTHLDTLYLYGDAFPKWFPQFGPGVAAAFLGADLEYTVDTTWFKNLTNPELSSLQPEFDDSNFWWQRVRTITRAALERWGDQVVVAQTDLGGNLDILSSLRGAQSLLLDLYDQPDEVERLTRTITRLWLRYHQELENLIHPYGHGASCWAPIWAPGKTYMLQSDFAYMLSRQMFEKFVLPDLEACTAYLDYAFYHLDGKGQIPHLDMLLSLERLRGVQWIPGDGAPPPEAWLPLLQRIRQAGKLCQVYVTRQGAWEITRALGGKGFLFYVWGDRQDQLSGNPYLTSAQAEQFLQSFQAEFCEAQ